MSDMNRRMGESQDRRRNVRASLRTDARLTGTDKWGNPFDIQCESIDFSCKGMGLILDRVIVARGASIALELPGRLKSKVKVQWVRFDPSLNRVRMGVRLDRPRASIKFRIAACILLSMAVLSQVSYTRTRWSFLQPSPGSRCNLGAQQMKSVIDVALAQPGMITDAEKSFVCLQHDHLSCEEYTRLFEQTNYYKSPGKREAMTKWHWETYHSHEGNGPGTPSEGTERGVGESR
jgi:hypothetical protein